MPTKPPRTCSHPRCPHPAQPGGQCTQHRATTDAERNRRRALSLAVYRSARWRNLRRQHLDQHPWCTTPHCHQPATDVDHITRIEDGGDPWDEDNLQSLCHPHHSEKTARETGFGGRHE